jgi:high-affinity iron transporter
MACPSNHRGAALVAAAIAVACGCSRGPAPDWDRAAFALEIARDEYPEMVENGDLRDLPKLLAVLDEARAGLDRPDERTHRLADGLGDLRAGLLRHDAPRVVAKASTRLLGGLADTRAPLRRPTARPDLARGAATYALACAPCHGPPSGPPPPGAAHMVPPPTRPTESVLTPYELFNRITYGGAGTAMPSFAETLPADRRWDIAFYLFADRWPPCRPDKPLPSLSAIELAHLSDYDLWRRYGWGAAPCLRRSFR